MRCRTSRISSGGARRLREKRPRPPRTGGREQRKTLHGGPKVNESPGKRLREDFSGLELYFPRLRKDFSGLELYFLRLQVDFSGFELYFLRLQLDFWGLELYFLRVQEDFSSFLKL